MGFQKTPNDENRDRALKGYKDTFGTGNVSETGQLISAIRVQEILKHIFCFVTEPKLPILEYIKPH